MLLLSIATAAALFAADLKIDLVTELHPLEAKQEQVFVADRLWSINSGTNSIDIFGTRLEKVKSLTLPHSLTRMAVLDSHTILVFGKLQQPWRFYFTAIDTSNYQLRTHQLSQSIDIFPDMFSVGEGGEIFISDIPGRGVWRYSLGGRLQKIPVDIAVPTHSIPTGRFLYVVENYGLGSEVSNIVKIDLITNAAVRLFEKTALLGKVADAVLSGDRLVVSEVWANRLTFIDLSTDKVVRTVELPGNPRDIEIVGRCLATISSESKVISFLNREDGSKVTQWDLSPAGDRLKQPSRLSIDVARGRIYARSSYPCMSCSVTQSSVFSVEEADRETFQLCR